MITAHELKIGNRVRAHGDGTHYIKSDRCGVVTQVHLAYFTAVLDGDGEGTNLMYHEFEIYEPAHPVSSA